MIAFDDLNNLQKVLSIVFVISIILVIISGFFVVTNETEEIKGKPFLRELLGGLDILFTSKYLNHAGKKWRIVFLISLFYIILWVVFIKSFN